MAVAKLVDVLLAIIFKFICPLFGRHAPEERPRPLQIEAPINKNRSLHNLQRVPVLSRTLFRHVTFLNKKVPVFGASRIVRGRRQGQINSADRGQ